MKWRIVGLLTCAALGAACGNNDTTTTTTAPTTPPPSPATETLEGTMAPNGTAIRTFTASKAGPVSVTLTSTTPAAIVGLGVGIRGATGADCKFTQTVNTPAGTAPQLAVSVDTGTYCAGAYDIGNIGPSGITVVISVTHP